MFLPPGGESNTVHKLRRTGVRPFGQAGSVKIRLKIGKFSQHCMSVLTVCVEQNMQQIAPRSSSEKNAERFAIRFFEEKNVENFAAR